MVESDKLLGMKVSGEENVLETRMHFGRAGTTMRDHKVAILTER